MLLNALNSTGYYVGSYARDARLRLSKAVQQLLTMAATSAPSETAHVPPLSLSRTSLASGGPGAHSAVRVLYREAISWRVCRLSRRRRRTTLLAATIVHGDGLSVAVGNSDGAAWDRNY